MEEQSERQSERWRERQTAGDPNKRPIGNKGEVKRDELGRYMGISFRCLEFGLYPECGGCGGVGLLRAFSRRLIGSGVHWRMRCDICGIPPVCQTRTRDLKHIMKRRYFTSRLS